MPIFDLDALTMNPEEAQSVSQAIFEQYITGGAIGRDHDIVTGIEHKTQIPFIGNLGLVGKKIESCSRSENGSSIPMTEKWWDPAHIGDRLKHCAIDIPVLFKLFQKARKMNPDFFDRIGTEEFGIIIAKVGQALEAMINRKAWFEDTTIDNVTNEGVLTDGIDKSYFNTFDGLFKQIFQEITVSDANYVEIPENSKTTKSEQLDLGEDRALNLFRAMFNSMDPRFYAAIEAGAQPELLVTRGLMQNYWDSLEDKSLSFSLEETKDGISRLSYRGIPIKTRWDWDNNIRSYEDNGTTYNLPNRAVLTVKENIPIGTLSIEDLTHLESWYEKKDKANYIDFDLKLDAKHLIDYMTVAAY